MIRLFDLPPEEFRALIQIRKLLESKLIIDLHLDMDGVLVNLESGIKAVMGEQYCSERMPDAQFALYRQTLYERIEAVPEFWLELPAHQALRYMQTICQMLKLKPSILTAFPAHYESGSYWAQEIAEQKRLWVQNHLTIAINRFRCVPAKEKPLVIAQNQVKGCLTVLIDDHLSNCQAFDQAGGIGLHYESGSMQLAQTLLSKIQDRQLSQTERIGPKQVNE